MERSSRRAYAVHVHVDPVAPVDPFQSHVALAHVDPVDQVDPVNAPCYQVDPVNAPCCWPMSRRPLLPGGAHRNGPASVPSPFSDLAAQSLAAEVKGGDTIRAYCFPLLHPAPGHSRIGRSPGARRKWAARCLSLHPCAYVWLCRFRLIGEALSPGPAASIHAWAQHLGFGIQPVAGDGSCLFACLGTHVCLDAVQTRSAMLSSMEGHLHVLDVADPSGILRLDTVRILHKPQAWGAPWAYPSGQRHVGCAD